MMYSEFISGTGCKDNSKNYQVYLNLNAMYNSTEMSKEEIYQYGRKLVDNSLTQEQIDWNAERQAKIDSLNQKIKWAQESLEDDKAALEWAEENDQPEEMKKSRRNLIKFNRKAIREYKAEVKTLQAEMYR